MSADVTRRGALVAVGASLLARPALARVNDPWLAAGLPAAGREGLRAAFQAGMDESLISGGSLLIQQRGQAIFNEAFGYADIAAKRAFTITEGASLASISKPHAATTLMCLVEDGLIGLDEPISSYMPAFADLRIKATGVPTHAPTLRQLLSHTAGFQGLSAGDGWQTLLYGSPNMARAAEAFARDGLIYPPGQGYAYSEIDFIVAAALAEQVTGKAFETLLRDKVLDPIGAASTTYFPDQSVIDQMPLRYRPVPGGLEPIAPRKVRASGVAFDPAGSLVANVEDVARLFNLHLNHGRAGRIRVLKSATVREMQTLQPRAQAYGLGINLQWLPKDGSRPIIRHGGATGTMAWADYQTGIVGVLLTQTNWQLVPEWSTIFYSALGQSGAGRMMTLGVPVVERGR